MIYYSKSPKDTFNYGYSIASKIKEGDIIGLEGSLGAGKSLIIRGVLSGLGITEIIPSPTFTLVNEYLSHCKIYHFDLYRLNDPYELYEIGFEEYIYSNGISLIEWYSKAGFMLSDNIIKINIDIVSSNERSIQISSDKF